MKLLASVISIIIISLLSFTVILEKNDCKKFSLINIIQILLCISLIVINYPYL